VLFLTWLICSDPGKFSVDYWLARKLLFPVRQARAKNRKKVSNQSMKPTAPNRMNASNLATTPCPWLISVSLDLPAMFSPFVNGLMCATLLPIGLSAFFTVTRGIAHQAPAAILFLWGSSVPLVVLALLLFTSSALIPRIAFWVLLVIGLAKSYLFLSPRRRQYTIQPSRHMFSTQSFHFSPVQLPCGIASGVADLSLTNRSSQPLAAPLRNFQMTSTVSRHITLALASGGSAPPR